MVSAPDCGSGDGSSILPEDILFMYFWYNPKITSISTPVHPRHPLWNCDNFGPAIFLGMYEWFFFGSISVLFCFHLSLIA